MVAARGRHLLAGCFESFGDFAHRPAQLRQRDRVRLALDFYVGRACEQHAHVLCMRGVSPRRCEVCVHYWGRGRDGIALHISRALASCPRLHDGDVERWQQCGVRRALETSRRLCCFDDAEVLVVEIAETCEARVDASQEVESTCADFVVGLPFGSITK